MAVFGAAAHPAQSPADTLVVQVWLEEGSLRIECPPARLGAWKLDDLRLERLSLYRFQLTTHKGDRIILYPDDPTGFSDECQITIDLTTKRFGLPERLTDNPQTGEGSRR